MPQGRGGRSLQRPASIKCSSNVIFIYGSIASTSHMAPFKPREGQEVAGRQGKQNIWWWVLVLITYCCVWGTCVYSAATKTLRTLGIVALRRAFTHTTTLFSHFLSPILSSPNVSCSPIPPRSKNILKRLFFAYVEQLTSLQPLSSDSVPNFS